MLRKACCIDHANGRRAASTLHPPPALPCKQSMANMVSALARLGPHVLNADRTRLLLAAFDARACALPPMPTHKLQVRVTC